MQSGHYPKLIDKSTSAWLLDGSWICAMPVSIAVEQCKANGGKALLYRDLKLVCRYPEGTLQE
jgi:hypothetical protein